LRPNYAKSYAGQENQRHHPQIPWWWGEASIMNHESCRIRSALRQIASPPEADRNDKKG